VFSRVRGEEGVDLVPDSLMGLFFEVLVGWLRDYFCLDGMQNGPEGVAIEFIVVDVASSHRTYCCRMISRRFRRTYFS
jgi:hypothetical protein